MPSLAHPMLSLVIPVYNNEESLPRLLREVGELAPKMPGGLEVVFVVDGSPDGSLAFLRKQLPTWGVPSQLIELSRNFGSFAAIAAGLRQGNGEFFAVISADLQEPPALALTFQEILAAGTADVVLGTRARRADPWLSQAVSGVFWSLYRRFVLPEMPRGGVDVFGCTRAVRDQLVQLREANTNLVALLLWLGFRRQWVPYDRRPRQDELARQARARVRRADERRVEQGWRDRVDPDAAVDPLEGQAPGELRDPALRLEVRRRVGIGDRGADRGYVHDRAALPLEHAPTHGLRDQETALQVHGHHPIPRLLGKRLGGMPGGGARALDQNVDPAKPLHDGGHQRVDGLAPGHVDGQRHGRLRELRQHGRVRLSGRQVEIGDDDARARLPEPRRDRRAQSTRPAGDEGHLAVEAEEPVDVADGDRALGRRHFPIIRLGSQRTVGGT